MNNQGWGKSVVEQLSKDLQREFPGIRGFSASNIWRMKTFYDTYKENKKLAPMVRKINWVQNCLIIEKCKDDIQREYYLKKTKQMGWSKLDLIDKINHHHFENQALAQNNFETTVSTDLKDQVAWEFVDDYNVELINPDQPFSEKELENTIVTNVVNFLADMGGSFAFVGRQYRLTLDEKEYFIDLLFFNFKLNCYVVFELKAREFQPKDMGQVQMYMQLVNKQVKQEQHNRTIGIVICKDKNRTEVEYMLEQAKNPVGVATFNKYENLPEEYAKYLPSEEEIIKRLANICNTL
jgi:predicted nuclease of restriction endonuclease-like (RecB) superfamily